MLEQSSSSVRKGGARTSSMSAGEVAEHMGLAAIVVQDLRAKRIKDYQFSWERILQIEGDSGPFLMYTHARLCSLRDAASIKVYANLVILIKPDVLTRDLA
jgi:arginyl-tRNA synthetase